MSKVLNTSRYGVVDLGWNTQEPQLPLAQKSEELDLIQCPLTRHGPDGVMSSNLLLTLHQGIKVGLPEGASVGVILGCAVLGAAVGPDVGVSVGVPVVGGVGDTVGLDVVGDVVGGPH